MDWTKGQKTRSVVAEGLRDIDIPVVVVAEGQYCLIEKPDLEIVLAAEAADLAENLWVSEDSAPLRPEAAEVKTRQEK